MMILKKFVPILKDFEIIKNNKIEIHNTNKYKNDKKNYLKNQLLI